MRLQTKPTTVQRPLIAFSGEVFYPHDSDRSAEDKRKRCVIFAYSEQHAKEITFMFLPPMRARDRFESIQKGCREYEKAYGKYPGIYVKLPGTSMQSYERLDEFYMWPESFSKNTQRKIGIEIGATYTAEGESRKVETITGDKTTLETLGLYETGDELMVHYSVGSRHQKCSVREFNQWAAKSEAKITEVHVRHIHLKQNERAVIEAACDAMSAAAGTFGTGDVVNAVMVDEIRAGFVAARGREEHMWGALNSLRHMGLVQFDGPKLPEGPMADDFDFWITGKGWCHWSKWKDELLLTIRNGASWDDKHLQMIAPAIRQQFLKQRRS